MISTINHINIEDAGFSYRVFSVLKRAGFQTIGEVIEKSDQQLLKIKGIGKKNLEEIKWKLSDSNYSSLKNL